MSLMVVLVEEDRCRVEKKKKRKEGSLAEEAVLYFVI